MKTINLKPGERIDELQRNDYRIIQNPGRFCFGMDAVLLSSFAKAKNERDDKGLITVYISNVDRSSGNTKLYGVDDENEWNRIKDVLRELSKAE